MKQEVIDRAAELYVHHGVLVYLHPVQSGLSEFIKLMEAVERLCPVWSARDQTALRDTGFRL